MSCIKAYQMLFKQSYLICFPHKYAHLCMENFSCYISYNSKTKFDYNCLFSDVRDLFRVWREDNCRDSEDIVELWESTLSAYFDKLGDEGWLVLEQVFVAALDCHNMEVANFCLSKLNQEFPESLRVKRLKAMKYEALQRYVLL